MSPILPLDSAPLIVVPAHFPSEVVLERGRAQLIEMNMALICEHLHALGGSRLTANYSGAWDNRDQHEIDHDCEHELGNDRVVVFRVSVGDVAGEAEDQEGNGEDDDSDVINTMADDDAVHPVVMSTERAIDRLVDLILEEHHEGFTSDAGGNGALAFNLVDKTCTMETFSCHEIEGDSDSCGSATTNMFDPEEMAALAWPSVGKTVKCPYDDKPPAGAIEVDVSGINMRIVFNALKVHGVDRIAINYEGEGDDGGVETTEYEGVELDDKADAICLLTTEGHPNRIVGKSNPMTLNDAFQQVVNDLVDRYHGGYDQSNGGGGSVVLDFNDGTVTWSGYENADSEYESHPLQTVNLQGALPFASSPSSGTKPR